MSAGDRFTALTVRCGLPGCDKPPGEPCINTVDGKGPRDDPHYNRVARGYRLAAQGLADGVRRPAGPPLMPGGESTSAQLRHAEQEMDVVRGSLTELAALHDSATAETARVERARASLTEQLDGAEKQIAQLERENERREETVARNVQERDRALDACDALREQRDLARAELATARAELEQLRAVQPCPDPAAHTTTERTPDA